MIHSGGQRAHARDYHLANQGNPTDVKADRITEALARAQQSEGSGSKQIGQVLRESFSPYVPNWGGPTAKPVHQTIVYTYGATDKKHGNPVEPLRGDLVSVEPNQAVRMIASQVLQTMQENGWRTLAFVSPTTSAARSSTAAGFATLLTRELGVGCLLVDANIRRPVLHEFFGLPAGPGLSDYLTRRARIDGLPMKAGIDGLLVLPAGTPIDSPTALIGSTRMAGLMAELKFRYQDRIIAFDLPPVLEAGDAVEFAPYADALLMIVAEGGANDIVVGRARQALERFNLIGVVLDQVRLAAERPQPAGFFDRLFKRA